MSSTSSWYKAENTLKKVYVWGMTTHCALSKWEFMIRSPYKLTCRRTLFSSTNIYLNQKPLYGDIFLKARMHGSGYKAWEWGQTLIITPTDPPGDCVLNCLTTLDSADQRYGSGERYGMRCFLLGTQQGFATKPTVVVATWAFQIPATKRQMSPQKSYCTGRGHGT